MVSKTENEKLEALTLKLPATVMRRVEAHMARLTRATPGMRVTKSDALRSLLVTALDRAENKANDLD